MALSIPSYPNPFNPAQPLQDAYAWISRIEIDIANNSGSVTVTVNPTAESWQGKPLDQIVIKLGEFLPPVSPDSPQGQFITLADLAANPAYAGLGAVLYPALLAHPLLSGASLA